MINYIKKDFKSVREALHYLIGKNIPFGIALIYYIIVGALALPFMPIVWVWSKLRMRRLNKEIERLGA